MVIILLTLFLAILPIYLIGNYYYKKDTVKEPKKLLQKLFFGGILSTIIVIIISIISFIVFPKYITTEGLNHFELLIYSFIFIALVEEVAKWLVEMGLAKSTSSKRHITDCCNKKVKSAYGYIWRYAVLP